MNSIDNWQQLEQDLRTKVLTQPAEFIDDTPYGKKYLIRAYFQGAKRRKNSSQITSALSNKNTATRRVP